MNWDPLVLTLRVGAANNAATDAQRVRLREELLPLVGAPLYQELGDTTLIDAKLEEIMGSEWKPSPDWQDQIDAFQKKAEPRKKPPPLFPN